MMQKYDNGAINSQPEQPDNKYRDPGWAIAFIIHLIIIVIFAFGWGFNGLATQNYMAQQKDLTTNDDEINVNGGALIGGIIFGCVAAAIFTAILLKMYIKAGEQIIHFTFKFNIALLFLFALIFLILGVVGAFILFFIFGLITALYYWCIRNRIEFASKNLKIACLGIGQYPATVTYAFGLIIAQVLWQIIWFIGLIGVLSVAATGEEDSTGNEYDLDECTTYVYDDTVSTSAYYNDAVGDLTCGTGLECEMCVCNDNLVDSTGGCTSSLNGGLVFLLWISLYWGSLVLGYISHVTTSGAIASYWYDLKEDPGAAVGNAFKRACTTSFGSICFGALIVAFVRALYQMVNSQRNRNSGILICIVLCCLRCLEWIIRYFNKYAFCYVAIFGNDFVTAGKNTWNLFSNRGWTTIINDDIIENALSFGCLVVGGLTALICWAFAAAYGLGSSMTILLVIVGLLLGYYICLITSVVIVSAVATIFVCLAEAPEPFQESKPELFGELMQAWQKIYPGYYNGGGKH